MSWHRWLLLKNDQGEKPLQVFVSLASLLFIIQMILGLWLWFKPKKRLKRLKINIKSNPRIKTYQLHTVIGVFTFIPLLLMAFSGMAFHWKSQIKYVLETLVGETVEQYQPPTIDDKPDANLQLDLAFNNARQTLIQGELYMIYLPANDQPLKLRIKMPDEFFAFSWVSVNPSTGKVIKSFDASKANLVTRIWNFKYKFHIGEFFGTGVKFIWLLLALLPTGFAVSGLWLYYKRTFKVKSSNIKAANIKSSNIKFAHTKYPANNLSKTKILSLLLAEDRRGSDKNIAID